MELKSKLSVLLILGLMSCSVNTPLLDKKLSDDVKIVKLDSKTSEQYLNINTNQVKDGASFSIKINSLSGFNTKASVSGSLAKTPNDIKSYEVYLIKNSASTYPANGNPIGDKVLGPYPFNTNSAESTTLTFNNVDNSNGDYYYVALKALDGLNATGNNLIKVNSNWTGITATSPNNGQVAVSTSGVQVSSTFFVTPANAVLTVNPILLDTVGAKIDSSITVNNGTTGSSTLTFNSVNKYPLGEFMVNTYTANKYDYLSMINPSVAMDSDGDFVVVWESRQQDGDDRGVYAQRYNSSGIPQGPEFKVNTYTTSTQSNPSVAMDSDGDFVVSWESRGQEGNGIDYGIYGQRYNSSGVPQGSEFHVNTYTINTQRNPSVAMDSNGDFVVTWRSEQDGSGYGIYGQRYNSSGVTQDSEFQVNTTTTSSQWYPSIEMDSTGNFVISWDGEGNGDDQGIFAQRYKSSGVPQGGEFRVNTYTAGVQVNSRVAMDSDGDFVVSWFGEGIGDGYGVYAQRYNSSGVAQGGELLVNTTTTDRQNNQTIRMDSTGNFVVSWQSNDQGGIYGVYAQRYNSSGVAQDSEFKVNTSTTNSQYASIGMDNSGNFVVSWRSYQNGFGIYAKRFDNNGLPK